jgi:hypothetical protein
VKNFGGSSRLAGGFDPAANTAIIASKLAPAVYAIAGSCNLPQRRLARPG